MSSVYSASSGGSGTAAAKARTTAVEQRIYQLSVHSDSTETISTTPLPPLKYIPKVPRLRILLAPYMSPYEVPMNSVRTWDALHRTIRDLFGDTIFSDPHPRITNKKGLTITPQEWTSLLTPNLTIIVDTCAILPEHTAKVFPTEKDGTNKYGYTPATANTARRRKKSAGRNELKRPIANVNVTAFMMPDRDSHDSSILDSPISPWGFNRGSSSALPVLRSRPMEPWEGWTSDSDTASGVVPAPLEPSKVRMKRSMEAMGDGKKSIDLKRSTSVSMFSGMKRGESQRIATQPKKKSSFASLRGKRSLDFRKQSPEMGREPETDFHQLQEKPHMEEIEQRSRAGTNPMMSRPRPSLEQTIRPKLSFDKTPRTHEVHFTTTTISKTPAPLGKPTRLTVYDQKLDLEPVTRSFEAPPVYEIPKIYEKSKLSTMTPSSHFEDKRPRPPIVAEISASETTSIPQRKKSTKAKTPPKKKSAWSRVINAVMFTFAGRPRNSMMNPQLSKPTQHDKYLQEIILDPSRQVPANPHSHPDQPKPTIIRPPQTRNPRPPTIDIEVHTPKTSSPSSPLKRFPSNQAPGLIDIAKSLPPLPPLKYSTSAPIEDTATFPRRQDSLPFPNTFSKPPPHHSTSTSSTSITSIFRSNSFTRSHRKRSSDSSITSISSISPPIPKRGPELDLGFSVQFRTPFMEKERIQELVHAESYLETTTTMGRSRSGTSASEATTAVDSEVSLSVRAGSRMGTDVVVPQRSNSQQSRVRPQNSSQFQQHSQKHTGYKLTAFPPPTQRFEVKNTVSIKQGVWQAPPLVMPVRRKVVVDAPPSPTSVYSTNTCGESFVLGRGRRVC